MPFINANSIRATVIHKNGAIRYQEVPTDWIVSHKEGVIIEFKVPCVPYRIPLSVLQDPMTFFAKAIPIYSNDTEVFYLEKAEFQKYLDS